MPSALRTYLLVNSPNASDWTAMRRRIRSYLLATTSAPRRVPMDLGYLPWSNKGKGKDGKGHRGHKGKEKDGKGRRGHKGDKGNFKGWQRRLV
eukprot:5834215-Amphidinium_carterae.1